MAERLLDYDPLTGLKTFHNYDHATGETSLRYEQDASAILDDNRAASAAYSRTSKMGEMVHVASIPVAVQLKWMVEKGVDVLNPDHKQAVAKLLDDPEWAYLKRAPLTLGRTR